MFRRESGAFRYKAVAFRKRSIGLLKEDYGFLEEASVFRKTAGEMAANPPASLVPSLELEPLLEAVGDGLRWKILQALAGGETLMVVEMAERIGASPSLVSKHLARLRKVGAVARNRAGLYRIPEPFLADRAARVVDFGPIVLRMVESLRAGHP